MTSPVRNISDIVIGERYRKDMGDIDALAESIGREGFIQPVAIRAVDNLLVAGARRLEAAKKLGLDVVPIYEVHTVAEELKFLKAEYAENTCRKDFTRSESVAMGTAIEERERLEAEKRKYEGQKSGGRGKKKLAGKLPASNGDKGDTRDKVAEAVGMSGRTYEKAKVVVEAAEKEPEKHAETVKEMDQTGNVDAAYQKVKDDLPVKAKRRGRPPGVKAARKQAKEGIKKAKKKNIEDKLPMGVTLANLALDVLRQIPENDALRKRGFQIVADWLKTNQEG